MTEQEAIICLKADKEYLVDMNVCDGEEMDVAITALEEIQKYYELERKLNGVDLTMLANHFMERAAEGEIRGYQRGRVLTNEHADKWDEYLAIGTPEECRAAVEKQRAKKVINNMPTDDDVWYQCPTCKGDLTNIRGFHCPYCGQKLDWSDEE